jgi:hypothetical protein
MGEHEPAGAYSRILRDLVVTVHVERTSVGLVPRRGWCLKRASKDCEWKGAEAHFKRLESGARGEGDRTSAIDVNGCAVATFQYHC